MSPTPPVDPVREEFERHGAWLRRLARGLLYERAGADDLVQAAWLAALRRGTSIESSRRPWLAGAVRKLARQWSREEARRERRERAAARPEAIADPPAALERLEVSQLLIDAVRALDEPYRTALLWRYFDGLSVREIAKRRGLPLETARTHVKRGLELVRRRIDAGRAGRREELLGALLPLAGPMPLALELGGAAVGKAVLKGAGAMSAGAKLGSVVAGAALLAIASWSLRSMFAEHESEPALDRGVLAEGAALDHVPDASPFLPDARGADAPTPGDARERMPLEAIAATPEEPQLAARESALTGRVHDRDGRPIAGAALAVDGSSKALTDADGHYRIELSPARSSWTLDVKAAGWSQVRQIVERPGAGELLELDFELRPEFCVVGRVEDEFGNPIEGAEVSSFYTQGNEATSAPDGRFTLGSLDPGRPVHMITARKVGFVRATEKVETQGRDEAPLVLRLARGVRVEGVVIDPQGAPLAGAELHIGFSPFAYDRLDAVADERGAFAFPAVGRGAQTLVTQRAGFAPDRRQILVPAEGELLGGLEIRLSTGGYLAGRVLDEHGEALEGVGVSAKHRGDYVDRWARTDSRGHFRLEGLPATDVSLELFQRGFLRIEEAMPELDRGDLVLRMQRSARLAGTVVDGPTGAPLPSFRIRFVEPTLEAGDVRVRGHNATWSREGHLFSESEGRWEALDLDVLPGSVIGVEASAPGYGRAVAGRAVATVEPDPAALVIALWPEALVRGLVLSAATGEAVSGASVKRFTAREPLRQADADDVHRRLMARTDAHGRFELRGVPAGATSLAVEHEDFAFAIDGPFEVPEGSRLLERTIELGAGARLYGRVLDADGRGLAGELVQLEARGAAGLSGRRYEAESEAGGSFRFERIPHGAYVLAHVLRDPHGQRARSVALHVELAPEAEEAQVELRPRGSATVLGGLESDAPLPGAFAVHAVRLVDGRASSDATHARGTLSAGGRFELRGLEPGEYQLDATRFELGTARRWSGSTRLCVAAGERAEAWIRVAPDR